MRYRTYHRNDPRIIRAKYNSTCAETKRPIQKGELCAYYPLGRKVFHQDSKQFQMAKEYIADLNMGNNY